MFKRSILLLAGLFAISLLLASEPDYSAINPITLPIYLGSLNIPEVEIKYEDPEGEYIIIEIDNIICVFFTID